MQRRSLIAGLASTAIIPHAWGQAVPTEIRMLVSFNAGGATDLLARRLQSLLEPRGHRLVVENLVGGGSMIAMNRLAQSPPDGRTLGLASHGLIAQIVAREIPLRLDQFTPLVRLATDPSILVTGAQSRFRTLADVVAAMRTPEGPSVGAAGPVGTAGHLRMMGIAQDMRGNFNYVGYTGAARLANELMGRHLDLGLVKPNDVFGQIRSGELRALAVLEEQRLPQLPEVPAIIEVGLNPHPFGRITSMTYAVAPAAVPPPLRDALIALLREAVLSPAFQVKAEEDCYVADGLSGAALQAAIAQTAEAIRVAQQRLRG
ncbi:tripartite tricarboxylate transporter substrate binding protein [Roseomonas hellenica]|uniref:Tripartite tricarboxylate transporter substrate binding protein n=1 Tax=Plastoroseomonas hellenica TaxID=2687306 RepID=A0ABS5F9N1_9PROT|nr:tripartite tricarboxylate transporter substrate binding protein [Plastoroseomonas hellenica]MBR0669273.1 tripartite tricarboxylate transporter substrate binding protein [Plastoroseomonas hellenica]